MPADGLDNRYLYLNREDYEVMEGKGAVVCEEVVDEASGETRFKIIVRKQASAQRNTAVAACDLDSWGYNGDSGSFLGVRVIPFRTRAT